MEAMDFDALVYKNQGFNTLDNLANSSATQTMSQQTLQSIQTMQTQMPKGHIPQHVVLPVLERQNEKASLSQQQFFVVVDNQQKGPFSLEQLKALAIVDVINEETQVWQAGTPAWTDLKTCLANLKM